jgi:hypothetical protein
VNCITEVYTNASEDLNITSEQTLNYINVKVKAGCDKDTRWQLEEVVPLQAWLLPVNNWLLPVNNSLRTKQLSLEELYHGAQQQEEAAGRTQEGVKQEK